MVEPASKRLRSTAAKQKLSGCFCRELADSCDSLLKENFVESPGKLVSQESVLSTLDLTEEKGLATRAVTKTFSFATINRRKGAYNNVRKAVSFERKEDNASTLDAESEIARTQALISEHRRRGEKLLRGITARVKAGDIVAIEALLKVYRRETELLAAHSEQLDELYERELQFVMRTNCNCTLSLTEKAKLTEEKNMLSKDLSFGLRSGEEVFISEELFVDLVKNVEERYPFLFDIVYTLFPMDNKRKEKGAVHSLSLLMSLRNN